MARLDQHLGLTPWTREFVRGEPLYAYTERVVRVDPDGTEHDMVERPVYRRTVVRRLANSYYQGLEGDQYPLYRYEFADGRVFEERVQADPWESGPQFYLALVDPATGAWYEPSLWREFLGDDSADDDDQDAGRAEAGVALSLELGLGDADETTGATTAETDGDGDGDRATPQDAARPLVALAIEAAPEETEDDALEPDLSADLRTSERSAPQGVLVEPWSPLESAGFAPEGGPDGDQGPGGAEHLLGRTAERLLADPSMAETAVRLVTGGPEAEEAADVLRLWLGVSVRHGAVPHAGDEIARILGLSQERVGAHLARYAREVEPLRAARLAGRPAVDPAVEAPDA